jgi:hypothetical protein
MRFYCEGEFDDSPVIDTVPRIIARPSSNGPMPRWRTHEIPERI